MKAWTGKTSQADKWKIGQTGEKSAKTQWWIVSLGVIGLLIWAIVRAM